MELYFFLERDDRWIISVNPSTYWEKTGYLIDHWDGENAAALDPIIEKFSLSERVDSVFEFPQFMDGFSYEQMKKYCLDAGLVENEAFTAFMAPNSIENLNKRDIDNSKKDEKDELPEDVHIDSRSVQRLYFGQEGKTEKLSQVELVIQLKQIWPTAIVHCLQDVDFERGIDDWDNKVYSFQSDAYVKEFTSNYFGAASKTPIPEKFDIYISESGDVCIDVVGLNTRMNEQIVKDAKEAHKFAAAAQKEQNKHDRKFEVVTELTAENELGQITKFKVHAVYIDSRGRGQIDIDIDNDINKEDIEALLMYINQQTEDLNNFKITGVAYEIDHTFTRSFSIRKFCVDQLHASAMDKIINEFTAIRNKIKKPHTPTN